MSQNSKDVGNVNSPRTWKALGFLFLLLAIILFVAGGILMSEPSVTVGNLNSKYGNTDPASGWTIRTYFSVEEEQQFDKAVEQFKTRAESILKEMSAENEGVLFNLSSEEEDMEDLTKYYNPFFLVKAGLDMDHSIKISYKNQFNSTIDLSDINHVIPVFESREDMQCSHFEACSQACSDVSSYGVFNGTHCLFNLYLSRLCISVRLNDSFHFVPYNPYSSQRGCYFQSYSSFTPFKEEKVTKVVEEFCPGTYSLKPTVPSQIGVQVRLFSDPRISAEYLLKGDITKKVIPTVIESPTLVSGTILVFLGGASTLISILCFLISWASITDRNVFDLAIIKRKDPEATFEKAIPEKYQKMAD